MGYFKGLRVYYPPEVSSIKYCCLGVFRKEYFRLVTKQCKKEKKTLKYWYSWVVKIRNTSEAVLRPQYSPWPLYCLHPMGLGQYDSLGEYCGPHTASSVFPTLICPRAYVSGGPKGVGGCPVTGKVKYCWTNSIRSSSRVYHQYSIK